MKMSNTCICITNTRDKLKNKYTPFLHNDDSHESNEGAEYSANDDVAITTDFVDLVEKVVKLCDVVPKIRGHEQNIA